MEPRAHHVLIGLFTLVAAIAAIAFALWLAKANQSGQVEHYVIVFKEPVRGLSRGSAVLYNGIRIGEVDSLRLNPDDLRMAQARISIDATIPVREDTQAKLVLTGITGNSVIELSGGSPNSPLLHDAEDGKDPEIIATPSPLTQLLAGGDHVMTNINELLLNANKVFSAGNVGHLSNTMQNLDEFTASLSEQRGDMKELLGTLTATSDRAGEALQHVTELLASTQTLVAEQGSATLEHAQRAMASLETASAALARLVTNNEGAVATGARGLTEIGPTLQALRDTLFSIQRVTRQLEENPGGFLLGRDKLPEFEP